jgi:hypothetical protein
MITGLITMGCEKGFFFRSDTEVTVKTILIPFEEISVNDIFEIELKNDTVFSAQMTGRKNILDNISVEVIGNSLEISDKNSYKWLPDYPVVKLLISFPDLSLIDINSASRVYSKDTLNISRLSILAGAQLIELDLAVDALYIHLRTGTDNYGHYTLKGYTESSDLWLFGSAQLWAGKLRTNTARVRNYSIGDCYVYVNNELRVWLEHYGNIYYYGSPEEIIIERESSRGRLIKVDD